MTGGETGEQHRESSPELRTDDGAVAPRPPGADGDDAPDIATRAVTDEPRHEPEHDTAPDIATPAVTDEPHHEPEQGDDASRRSNHDAPEGDVRALDDPAELPPIVEATSPEPRSTTGISTPPAPTSAERAASTPAPPVPSTPAPSPPARSTAPPSSSPSAAGVDPDDPELPRDQSDGRPATVAAIATPTASAMPSASAYRSTEERNRSVYRRANPWYRRLARGTIAACLIAAFATGIYLGAREIQDYIDRDRLPAPGAEIPTIRETSFLIESTASGVTLDGTLALDVQTGAFEFVGSAGGANAADRLTSPDGTTVYAQGTGSTWIELPPNAPIVSSVKYAVELLSDDNTADAILTNRIRRGYVDLVRQIEEGTEGNTRTRYDITLDLTPFAESFPLQWQSFQADAIPGVRESRRHPLSFWLDDDDVLVQVADEAAGWNWQRLTYSASAFEPFVPAPIQIEQSADPALANAIPCTVADLGLTYSTTLPTCDDAADVGRGLVVTAGIADDIADPATELAFVSLCGTIQGDEVVTYELDAYLDLAILLNDTGVCPGDIGLVQVGGG